AMVLKTPMAMVRTPTQWLGSDHGRESGAVVEVDDPTFGSVVMPGPAFEVGATLASVDAARVIAAEAQPEPDERPLHGVRVLELTQAVAGPTAARLLADLGADVIKVGSTTPGVTDGIVGHLHRGKRTILLDSSGVDGRRVLDRLVQRADALVTNFMPAAAAKYGVDEDRLASVNPQLVLCSISAYGRRGPWAERRAYENQCNAATGMSQSYGAPFGWTLYQPTPINDAATGILAAYATIVGLFARGRDGVGQRVATSLAQASTWHQAMGLVRSALAPDEQSGARSAQGTSALQRLYKAGDRSLFLAAFCTDVDGLQDCLGVDIPTEVRETWREPDGAFGAVLAERFATRSSASWKVALDAAGIAAEVVQTLDEATAYLATRGLVYFEPGLDGDMVARPGIGAWLAETPPAVGPNPGAVGSQALEILAELDFTADDVAALAATGVVCLPDHLPQVALRT
ncbi:MAG TPA: CoA transferase, partial [Ilumatobacteraceae bacterium]